MKIRIFSWFIFIPILIAALVELSVVTEQHKIEIESNKIWAQRHDMIKYVDEMRMTSEFLTRLARRYANMKESRALEWYNQIVDIRDGKIARPPEYNALYWDLAAAGNISPPDIKGPKGLPLTELFARASNSKFATQKFIEAKSRSDDLARIERIAFHAMNGEFDDGTEKFKIKGKEDKIFANKILYDKEYEKAKGQIISPLSDITKIIELTSNTDIERLSDIRRSLSRFQFFLTLALLIWTAIGIAYLYFRVVVRLGTLEQEISVINEGDLSLRSKVSGNDEIGKISAAVTGMSNKIRGSYDLVQFQLSEQEKISQELASERRRATKILRNLFPSEIAAKIINDESVDVELIPEASILFARIVDFTSLASNLGPQRSLVILNEFFDRFDSLCEKLNIERIKTQGDCYIAACGIPIRDPRHCQLIAEFALSAQKEVASFTTNNNCNFEIRMGIHTGPITAGVVGKKFFSYEVWGETIDLAARIGETSGAGKIHISESVKIRLNDDFVFENTGEIKTPAMKTVQTYNLLSRKFN